MGVNPKIGGNTPKWMVKIRDNPIKMDDLRGKPALFLETPIFVFGGLYFETQTFYVLKAVGNPRGPPQCHVLPQEIAGLMIRDY